MEKGANFLISVADISIFVLYTVLYLWLRGSAMPIVRYMKMSCGFVAIGFFWLCAVDISYVFEIGQVFEDNRTLRVVPNKLFVFLGALALYRGFSREG